MLMHHLRSCNWHILCRSSLSSPRCILGGPSGRQLSCAVFALVLTRCRRFCLFLSPPCTAINHHLSPWRVCLVLYLLLNLVVFLSYALILAGTQDFPCAFSSPKAILRRTFCQVSLSNPIAAQSIAQGKPVQAEQEPRLAGQQSRQALHRCRPRMSRPRRRWLAQSCCWLP